MADPKLLEGDPLDRLPALVNDVLIQIGRSFRDPSLRDAKLSSLDVKAKNQLVIPQANLDFHDILDDIEVEIENAKAVFERDLAIIRAKCAEREKAAGITRLRLTNEEKTSDAGVTAPIATTATQKHGSTTQDPLDVEMPDAAIPTRIEEQEVVAKPPSPREAEALQQPAEVATNPPQPPQIPASDLFAQAQPSVDTIDFAATTGSAPPHVDTTAPPISTSLPASPLSATFNSMFPDPSPNDPFGSTDQNDFDFDIDFSAIADTGPAGGDLDLSALNTSTAPQASAPVTSTAGAADGETGAGEDINSLLPGLENFVNSGADFDMLELGSGSDAAAVAAAAVAAENIPPLDANAFTVGLDGSGITNALPATTMGEDDKAMEAPPGESSFDDLFFANDTEMDFGTGLDESNGQNGGGDGDANDDMADFEGVSDFDESWFK